MRVDRLVAVLLLLQERGHVTAAEVAAELEVSERTARRDLDALTVAGLPVYSTRGRNGGWRLAGGGRTDLSGLNLDEARALVLAVGSASDLGTSVRAGLRKLQRALPEQLRATAATAAAVTIVDPSGWERRTGGAPRTAPPLLDQVHRATVAGERIVVGYRARDGAETEREVDPHAVVNHGGTWYLLAGTDDGDRTFRVDRMRSVEPTGRQGARPLDYDAGTAWRDVVARIDELRAPVVATVRARPEVGSALRWVFGRRIDAIEETGGDGSDAWSRYRVRGHHVEGLARDLAAFGGSLVVDDPPELRRRLADIGRELVDAYADAGGDRAGARLRRDRGGRSRAHGADRC